MLGKGKCDAVDHIFFHVFNQIVSARVQVVGEFHCRVLLVINFLLTKEYLQGAIVDRFWDILGNRSQTRWNGTWAILVENRVVFFGINLCNHLRNFVGFSQMVRG